MKKSMFTISIIVSLTTLAVFVIGWIMQALKADIDTMPAERFDLIMNIYKIGNILKKDSRWSILCGCELFFS